VISGTPGPTAAEDLGGTYDTKIIVTGADGGSSSIHFPWIITPPIIVTPDDQTNGPGDAVDLQIDTALANGDTLEYAATGLPAGTAIDPDTGEITGTIAPTASASNVVTLNVLDDDTGVTGTATFHWTVGPPAYVAPTMDPIDDQANGAGDTVDVTPSAYGSNALTYTATGLPTGLAIDPASGEITGTPAVSAFSTTPYQVTVTANDGTNSDSTSFAWTINAVGLASIADQNNLIGDTVSLATSGQDATGRLGYSATGLPNGLTIDPVSGLISGTVAAGATWQGWYNVVVTATDGTNSASQEFNWTLLPATTPAAPVVTAPAAQTNQTGDVVSLASLGCRTHKSPTNLWPC
jgi:hypothetical protein